MKNKSIENIQLAKADSGKPRISLVPTQIIRDIAAVREYGNQKYGDPEDGEDVLIVSSWGISLGCYDACERYWVDHVNSEYDPVTHWMPLPEPPKEDE